MKRLSKQDLARRDDIVKKLRKADLEDAHRVLMEAVAAYNAKVDDFNELAEEARGFGADMDSEIDAYMSERSERWLDGDAGQAYTTWKEAWQEINNLADVEHIEVAEFEDPEIAGKLEDAPIEPEV